MTFKQLFTLINSDEWFGIDENIEILKGKYHKSDKPMDIATKAIRKYKEKNTNGRRN